MSYNRSFTYRYARLLITNYLEAMQVHSWYKYQQLMISLRLVFQNFLINEHQLQIVSLQASLSFEICPFGSLSYYWRYRKRLVLISSLGVIFLFFILKKCSRNYLFWWRFRWLQFYWWGLIWCCRRTRWYLCCLAFGVDAELKIKTLAMSRFLGS